MRISAAILAALLFLAPRARADDSSSHEIAAGVVPSADGYQELRDLAVGDGISLGLLVPGVGIAGMVGYAIGGGKLSPTFIHGAFVASGLVFLLSPSVTYLRHGSPWRAGASLAARAALPLLGFLAMIKVADWSCRVQSSDNNDTGMCALAGLIPLAAAVGVGAAVPYLFLHRDSGPAIEVAPSISSVRGKQTLGLSVRF